MTAPFSSSLLQEKRVHLCSFRGSVGRCYSRLPSPIHIPTGEEADLSIRCLRKITRVRFMRGGQPRGAPGWLLVLVRLGHLVELLFCCSTASRLGDLLCLLVPLLRFVVLLPLRVFLFVVLLLLGILLLHVIVDE